MSKDSSTGQNPPLLKTLLIAARPKTLPAAIVPVMIGGALAYKESDSPFYFSFIFLNILLCASLIQVLTNYVNDLWDFKKGSDTSLRIGPTRVVQSGMITPEKMTYIVYILTTIILLSGSLLVYVGGLPIFLIGILSVLFAYAYTAGPFPIAHYGYGEIFVLIFFGPVATMGTFYLLTNSTSIESFILGLGAGCLSCALLVTNNVRDIPEDRSTGKHTLAARFGYAFALKEYIFFLIFPFVLIFPQLFFSNIYKYDLTALLILIPIALLLMRKFVNAKKPADFNPLLPISGLFLVIYGIFSSVLILT